MTRPGFVDRLFPDGALLYYEGFFKGARFIQHWTRLERANERELAVSFFLEIDPKPLGQGGSIMRQRCQLVLDPELRPVRYFNEAAGARLAVFVEGAKATVVLPDGARTEVPFGDARWIVEANVTGLDAILYAIAFERGELLAEARWSLFLVNQLLIMPYAMTPAGPGVFTTSHEELVKIDERGVLESTEVAKAGVKIERKAAPPLPFWHRLPDGTRHREQLRYVPPASAAFELQNLSIATARGEVGGTITIPRGGGRHPAVLFLSGTGSHDRHGIAGEIDLGTHEVIDYLSNHGLVGLRYDTRGAGSTPRGADPLDTSLQPLLDDARSWFHYLTTRPEVDPERIAVIGHSQGGTLALLLATGEAPLPFHKLVLMATPGRVLHEILLEQIDHRCREMGLADAARERQLAELREIIDAIRAGRPFEAGAVPDYLVPAARQVAWFKDHLEIDPARLVGEVRVPLLIVQGGKDIQVPPSDAERLAAAAREAGRDVEHVVLPDLDHMFKHTDGPSTLLQYYDTTRRVDAGFLARLAAWLTGGLAGGSAR